MKNIPTEKFIGLPGLNLPGIKTLGLKQLCLGSELNTMPVAGFNSHNFIISKTGKRDREKKPISAGRGGKYYSKTSAMGRFS